jgi:hypothetical protein
MSRRPRTIWLRVGGRGLLTVIVIGGGSLGLTLFACQLSRQDRLPESENHPGGGIIIRSKMLRLWLPGTLIELANPETLA